MKNSCGVLLRKCGSLEVKEIIIDNETFLFSMKPGIGDNRGGLKKWLKEKNVNLSEEEISKHEDYAELGLMMDPKDPNVAVFGAYLPNKNKFIPFGGDENPLKVEKVNV